MYFTNNFKQKNQNWKAKPSQTGKECNIKINSILIISKPVLDTQI